MTNASAKDGRAVAGQFERFRAVFERLTEGGIARTERPVEVLVLRDERSMRAVAPEYWEGKNRARPAGLFVRGPDRQLVALQLDRLHASLQFDAVRDFATEVAEAGYIVNPYHVVFHEYAHVLLHHNERLPMWLTEGIAEFYANTIVEADRVVMGKPNVSSLRSLRELPLLPLDRLLQVTRDSPEYRDADATLLFYAQSWALFHMLRVGDKGANRERLTAYQAAVEGGAESLNAARQAFGDLRAFQAALVAYIRKGAFEHEIVPGNTRVDATGWTTRTLAGADAALAQARFLAQTRRPADAEAMLAAAAAGGPESAGSQEIRALLARQAGRMDEAGAHYQRAVDLGSTSALAHFEIARLAFDGETDVTRLGDARQLLEKAIALDAGFGPAYALLGEVLLAQDREPQRAYALGSRAAELMPADIYGYVVASRAALRLDRNADAMTLARRAMSLCKSDAERDKVAPLLTEATRRAR